MTLPETGAPDPYIGEQRRGVPGWVIIAAAGLVAMVVSQRQGADAVEENPTADSATQQNSEMAEAVVPDPASIDQGEANADQAGDIAPAAAVAEPPGPTLDVSTILQGLMEPSSITNQDGVTALSLTEPDIPVSDPQDQDLDDMPNL